MPAAFDWVYAGRPCRASIRKPGGFWWILLMHHHAWAISQFILNFTESLPHRSVLERMKEGSRRASWCPMCGARLVHRKPGEATAAWKLNLHLWSLSLSTVSFDSSWHRTKYFLLWEYRHRMPSFSSSFSGKSDEPNWNISWTRLKSLAVSWTAYYP